MRRAARAITAAGLLPMLTIAAACTPAPRTVPPSPPADRLDPAQPAVMGASNGLEMRVWVIEDQDDVLAETLARYEARPTPMLDSVRTAWHASGLRVIEVPHDELAGLRDKLRTVAPEQRDWFGQSPDWSEAIRGRRVPAGTVLRLADGLMKAPAGRLRVLMRCWTVPGESLTEPALHTELAVQLERRRAAPSLLELPALASELESGVVFPRLRATLQLSGDSALLIVPMGDAPLMRADTAEQALREIGPPEPVLPTLGEAMLSSAAAGTAEPVRRRAIVALLPRLPERFTLGGASAAQPR